MTTAARTVDACTIVSCNYIPFARVLARSFLAAQPESRFFVLLLDRNDGRLDPEEEPFELIEVAELDEVPDLPSFLFRYTILEANTAVKPFFLRHLLEQKGSQRLLYLDPDILVTGSLDHLAGLVGEHSLVLTPHLTDPIDDGLHPGEQAILQAGSYNLGFLGLRNDPTTHRFLGWWEDRLIDKCVVKIEDGLFVDQKWMDLTPGLFGDVHVLDDPGYNVAYWNLHGRTVRRTKDGWTSNDRPLVFFHFSGIQPESLDQVSKHQNRFRLGDIGEAADLYRHYSQRLLDEGWHQTRGWAYAFATFDNGVVIPDVGRRLYLDLGEERTRFGNPFETSSPERSPYLGWLLATAGSGLPRVLDRLWANRPDLRTAYPDPGGRDLQEFAGWLDVFGRHELRLDEAFLDALPIRERPSLLSPSAWKRRLRHRARRVWHSKAGEALRARSRTILGPDRTEAMRRRFRRTAPGAPSEPARTHQWTGRFQLPSSIERPGVNLIGYLDAETGMGQGARALARALEAAEIPVSLHNLDLHVLARRGDDSFGAPTSDFPWDINLLFVNADQVQPVVEHLGPGVFSSRYNVGIWLWELERFPADRWPGAFLPLHEVWTPSRFCLEAIAAEAPIPVRRVPLPVLDPGPATHSRDHFDLPEGAFVVFFMFNYLSWFERKNPLAVIEAFRKAFGDDADAILLLKTSQGDFAPESRDAVMSAIDGAGNIRLEEDYLDRAEIDSLCGLCDVYVSLHRTEGFGLTVAEAMLRERPVLATDYSGTADFLDPSVGCPVPWVPLELEVDEGPYPAGAIWADPDVDAAARELRRLRDDPELRRRLGEAARERITSDLSAEAVGRTLRERFDWIVRAIHRTSRRPPH